MKRLRYVYIIIILTMVSQLYCSKEYSQNPGELSKRDSVNINRRITAGDEDRRIKLKIELSSVKQTKSREVNEIINSIEILVYDSTGALRSRGSFSDINDIWAVVPNGQVTIAAITNSNESDFSRFIDLDSLNKASTNDMFGAGNRVIYSGKKELYVNNQLTSATLPLKRVIAKVTVVFDKHYLSPGITIDVTKVQLKNVPLSVLYLGENRPDEEGISTYGDYITQNTQPLNHETASPLYMFENLRGIIGENSTPSLKSPGAGDNLCSYLEITAEYSSPAKRGTIIYRSYLGENNTNNFNVFRETHYKESVRFNGTSINEISWRVDISNLVDITYHISTSASPADGGIVYGTGNYYYGYYPSLLAVAAENFRFSGWSPPMAPVTENRHYTAIFEYVPPYINVTSISLSESMHTLYSGDSYQLTSIINPHDATDKRVTWSSSASDVVETDNTGMITGLKAGTSIITATSICGGHIAGCNVIVVDIEPPSVPVTGITLDKSSITLTEGGYQSVITATIHPSNATNQEVIWGTSQGFVATVSNGVVTSGSVGDAVITATTSDGGFTSNCNISVIPVHIPVTSINLSSSHIKMDINEKYTLTATLYPYNATNKSVEWISSDSMVASIDPVTGEITAKTIGVTVITARSVDGNHTAHCVVNVYSPLFIETAVHEMLTYDSYTSEIISAELILYARVAMDRPSNMSIVNSISPFVNLTVNYSYTSGGSLFSGTTTLFLNTINNNDSPWIYVTGITELFSFHPPLSGSQISEAIGSFTYSVLPGSVYTSIYHITW